MDENLLVDHPEVRWWQPDRQLRARSKSAAHCSHSIDITAQASCPYLLELYARERISLY